MFGFWPFGPWSVLNWGVNIRRVFGSANDFLKIFSGFFGGKKGIWGYI
jgi:hypothetical protein